jgi:hypothetical protein
MFEEWEEIEKTWLAGQKQDYVEEVDGNTVLRPIRYL